MRSNIDPLQAMHIHHLAAAVRYYRFRVGYADELSLGIPQPS